MPRAEGKVTIHSLVFLFCGITVQVFHGFTESRKIIPESVDVLIACLELFYTPPPHLIHRMLALERARFTVDAVTSSEGRLD